VNAVLTPPPPAGWFDPAGNQITEILNHYVNFGWEYVWHCHILAHEEMDMMHSLAFVVPPDAPSGLTATASGQSVILTWTGVLTATNYRIQRAINPAFTMGLTTLAVGPVTGYTDTSIAPNTTYYYRVLAYNVVGDTLTPGFPTVAADSPYSNTAFVGTCTVSFNDVPAGFWAETYIKGIYCTGITTGCTQNPLNYCPSNNVTRAAMAAFIIRAKFGEIFTYTTTPYFTDVPPSHQFFKYIQKMKDEGITSGYPDGTYRPGNYVTRAAMAAYIIRALYGETFNYTITPYFTDVPPSHPFFKYIQKMKDDGITTGCTATQYCPSNNVTRAATAAFLARAFLGMP
jgi:hypothetical protein